MTQPGCLVTATTILVPPPASFARGDGAGEGGPSLSCPPVVTPLARSFSGAGRQAAVDPAPGPLAQPVAKLRLP